jgi:sigma-B regulation protein RsbU (phosphoserine phosphatase)
VNPLIPPLPALNVRTKILIIFLALSLISLLITGFAAFYTINDIGISAGDSSMALGKVAIHDSTEALTASTEENMIRVASDQALLIDEIFWETEMELNVVAAQARSMQNNPSYLSQIQSSVHSIPPRDPLNATLVILAPGSLVQESDEEYQALAGMDDLLAGIHHADGDLTSVYIATESGILRVYPWNANLTQDYDPRTRSWFMVAQSSDRPVWTEPYMDAYGLGPIITCAKSVRTKYGTWVIASDVTIDQLNKYTSLTLDGTDYAVLLDHDGTIISRPGLSANGARWNQPFPEENVFSSTNPGLVAVGRNMTAGRTGLETVQIGGSEKFIAYAPVSSLNWSYGVSVNASKIVEPIKKTELNIINASVTTNNDIIRQMDRLLYIFAGLFILLLLIVIILSCLLARIITRPVDALRQGTMVIGSGDLDFRLNINSGDEFEDLARSFNRMASDLKDNIENLRRTTAEKERYAKEMEIAKEIQDTFLPESVPKIPGFEVAAVTIPAMEIGGDLYDFIPVAGERTGFVIADVSGKGVSAALYMALSRTLLHASGGREPEPSRALRNANCLIYDEGRSSMFITVFYGVLDPGRMQFSYVNAGHNPPLLMRPGEAGTWMTDAKGIALGVIPDVNIVASTLDLRRGDTLILYTDGVTEAFNEQEEYFGEERLLDSARRHRSQPAQEIMMALLEEITGFAGSAPQSDDITLVVIRVL